MVDISRRSFIAGAAVIPFAVWLEKYAGAQPSPGSIRAEATTTQGQAMLREYAQAVAKMKQMPPSDPRSWVFQWYTHFVNSATNKDAEVARIFGPNPGPAGRLAGEMWNTCQAHDPSTEDENFFLPWHRMFVYFFERIVRSAAGDPSFALPYWNYSTTDPATHGVMPAQFRTSDDPTFRALFLGNRNPGVNDGQPIDQGQPGDLSLSVLNEGTYVPDGADPGFCQNLDANLHGNVHVDVGDTTNMGSIPTAANDPIFWMHHCNIDRLWASWNANGGMNPGGSWLTQQFIFADENGKRVAATVQDFVDIGKLGYSYDRLEPKPAGFRPLAQSLIGKKVVSTLAKVAGPLTLGAGPTSASLEGTTPGVTFRLPNQVKSLLPQKKLYLVMRNLSVEAQPGVIYHVYLDLPAGTTPQKGDPHHVGAVNFFAAMHHHAAATTPRSGLTPRFLSMEVTSVAKALQGKGMLSQQPSVSVVPFGKPAEEAKPVIGEITLVEQ